MLLVPIFILGLIALAIFGLSRLSDAKRSGGTSLRRTSASHINVNGSPKRGYASMDAAQDAAKRQTAMTNHPMSAYKCGACKHYHIGHA
jgi:Sec-independent protein translocase protein TatA